MASGIKRIVSDISGPFQSEDEVFFRMDPKMYSFKFHAPHEYDELTCAVIVRIDFRDPPVAWAAFGADPKAKRDAQALAYSIGELYDPTQPLFVGVEMRLNGASYWGSTAHLQ